MRINQFSEGIELGDDNADKPAWFIVREDGKIASGPYNSERDARSDTARLQWFTPSQYFIDYGIEDNDNMFVDIETGQIGEEIDGIPEIGDVIRTKKMQMEGKVERLGKNRAGYDEVFFRVWDGRLMVSPLSNVTVIEKLADEVMEEIIDEVSTELLAKYKTAAGKSASEADKRGDYATGNKRFSGIVQATKKQFDNDKKKSQNLEELGPAAANKRFELESYFNSKDKVHVRMYYEPASYVYAISLTLGTKQYIMYPVDDIDRGKLATNALEYVQNILKNASNGSRTDFIAAASSPITDILENIPPGGSSDALEGTMGGINRSAPSNDVSYEHVLDEVKAMWEKAQLNELSIEKLKAYKDAATSMRVAKHAPLRKVAKHMQGAGIANQKIKTKTGNKVVMYQPDRGSFDEDSIYEDLKKDFGDLLGRQ